LLTLNLALLRIDAKPQGKPTMLRAVCEARLIAIMRDVFDEDELVYRDDLTADDVIGWDSLSHVPFLASVEKSFGFRFTSAEIDSLKNVGELRDVILRRATI
jgi:acyl carrier protein